MSDAVYHLERETRNSKNYLDFDLLKQKGAAGKLMFQGKKVVVDPFSPLELVFEVERVRPDCARVTAYGKLREQKFPLSSCEWVVAADPSWVLHEGIIRAFKEGSATRWLHVGPTLEGKALFDFLEDTGVGAAEIVLEPRPFLKLADRHGAFADLWFDYGSLGHVAAHDRTPAFFRNRAVEKREEQDLLESAFTKKQVDATHYYCPLDQVAKSLTFLLEVGWEIFDAKDRQVLLHTQIDFDAQMGTDALVIQAKVSYADVQVDLARLVGAFNRREQFVELSPKAVALLDREEWSDLSEAEVAPEGIVLKKNRMGLLESLLQRPSLNCHEELRSKLETFLQGKPFKARSPSPDFQGTLFAYQQQGVEWLQFLHEGRFGGLLADEMGLGKTVQVVAFFSQLPLDAPLLVVAPTSLLFNWQQELERFLPTRAVYRHEGPGRVTSAEELRAKSLVLTSYALLRIDSQLFDSVQFHVMILDEAQVIKNPASQISEICCRVPAHTRIALTGTPVENRLEDLGALFRFLQPDLLEKQDLSLERIRKKIRPFLLRRKKQDVALQLPPKLEQTVFVEMTEAQRTLYEEWLKKTRKCVQGTVSPMEILEAILRLRQLCAHPHLVDGEAPGESAKFERLLSDLKEVVEQKRKVLVYSQFTSMLRLIERAIKEQGWSYVYLDGQTQNREEVVRRFQEEESVSIFLISLKAGGVGLNLTAADYVFLYDPWWNEAVERQAIDRAHRMGRHEAVIARRYITALSIEEKIQRLKAHKTQLSQALLDGDDLDASPSLEDLLNLLN